jgi:hypothetical protein
MSSTRRFNSAGVIRQTLIKVEKLMNRTSLARGRNRNIARAKPGRIRAQRGSSKENGKVLKGSRIRISRRNSRRSKNKIKINSSRKGGGRRKNLAKARRLIMSGLNRKKKPKITSRISAENDTRLSQTQRNERNVKRCTKNGTLIRKATFIGASGVFRIGR